MAHYKIRRILLLCLGITTFVLGIDIIIIILLLLSHADRRERKNSEAIFSGGAFQTICPVIYVQKMGQNIHFLMELWTAVTWLRAKRFDSRFGQFTVFYDWI